MLQKPIRFFWTRSTDCSTLCVETVVSLSRLVKRPRTIRCIVVAAVVAREAATSSFTAGLDILMMPKRME